MSIITVPHPTLRLKAKNVEKIDKNILNIIATLKRDLTSHDRGVGLAAVQIDKPIRIFSTYLEKIPDDDSSRVFTAYINPEITHFYGERELGGDKESTPLEGCLSIPNFYGPVPRFRKIKIKYQTVQSELLIDHEEEYEEFFARVIQHEMDHLNGILFTDYALKYDLPIYKENLKSGKLIEIEQAERKIFEVI